MLPKVTQVVNGTAPPETQICVNLRLGLCTGLGREGKSEDSRKQQSAPAGKGSKTPPTHGLCRAQSPRSPQPPSSHKSRFYPVPASKPLIWGQVSTTKSGSGGHSVNSALTPQVPAAGSLEAGALQNRSRGESLVTSLHLCTQHPTPNLPAPPPPLTLPAISLHPRVLSHSGPEAWLLERNKGWGSRRWWLEQPGSWIQVPNI